MATLLLGTPKPESNDMKITDDIHPIITHLVSFESSFSALQESREWDK